ncbi:hypothetical protein MYAM1_003560 [Malassezia yamatoensis]|uniref:PWWP domain-containing protein n=1 Tax=Malassezia yamatoensis TaxID=253288 RepID=A0AAJ5Z093_9BASI|nr:hypothetical protein MYAM1_003560 [Malassezia yamatoensis]
MASQAEYRVGNVVLAKIRGFPAWPGIIVDDQDVPAAVRAEKPANKNANLYTIRFFPTADYHWAAPRDLSHLSTEDIEKYLASSKKTNDLQKAYKLARDPHSWNADQTQAVRDHDAALADVSHDAPENDQSSDTETAKPKRKRTSQAATRKKSKASPPASHAQEEPKEEAREETEEPLDPATKKVREWRHKLQRAFLSKDGVIKAEDMDAQNSTFQVLEEYQEMTPEQLKVTKIGKVIKRIHQLPDIPKDDQYHFRDRSGVLMNKWGAILSAATSTEPTDGSASQ